MDIVVRPLPELSSVISSWVALLLIYLLLKHFLHEPVTKLLNERKEKIQEDIKSAEVLQADAETLRKDYEAKLELAKEESQKLIESGRQRGEEIRRDIVQEAEAEARRIKDRSKKDIERERAAALRDMKVQTGEMAVLIASKLLEEELTLDNQDVLIDKFIDEVGSSTWQN